MDWLEHMNAAMDYIEAHLADEISYCLLYTSDAADD